MFRRFAFIVIGLALISDVSRREGDVLVHLFALPAALVLYPLAYLVLLAILAGPLVYGVGMWLLWRWTRDGRLPASVERPVRWLRARRPWCYRLRLERVEGAERPATPRETPHSTRASPDGEAIHPGA